MPAIDGDPPKTRHFMSIHAVPRQAICQTTLHRSMPINFSLAISRVMNELHGLDLDLHKTQKSF